MEPFTMMLGYGLVNSLSQLVIRPIADKMSAPQRRADMFAQMQKKHKLDLEAVRLNKQIELDNQIDIQKFCHNQRMAEAQTQFDRQLQMWQIGKFNDTMWPLLTPFDHPSLRPQQIPGQRTPLNVFLATTAPHTPFAEMIQPDLKIRMTTFMQTAYCNDPLEQHPCICRIGDWKPGFQDAASINALWYGMQGIPTIVINPMQAEFGEKLDLTVSMWGLGEKGNSPKMQNVLTGNFASAIGRIKREKSKEWVDRGLPVSSPEMIHNKNLLDQEKQMTENGKQKYLSYLLVQYRLPKEIQNDVITTFSSEYNHIISCITGMYADIYHLIEYGAQPYMPTAINQYNKQTGQNFQIPDLAIDYYRHALTTMVCTDYLQDKLPSAYMGVAKSLSFTPKNSMQIFKEGVGLWANKKTELNKEVPIPDTLDECLRLLYDNSENYDKPYLELAQETLISMDEQDAARSLDKKISILVEVPEPNHPQEETEWIVEEKFLYSDDAFRRWALENKTSTKKHNVAYAIMLFRDNYFVSFFVDSYFNIVSYDDGKGGVCTLPQRYFMSEDIVQGDIALLDLKSDKFKNSYKLMEKKDFDSFERLGKQLDALINNLGKIPNAMRVLQPGANQSTKRGDKTDFYEQITQVFSSNNFVSMESEQTSAASLESVKQWIVSKMPVKSAIKAHILKTKMQSNVMVCVFFADANSNALISNDYPMKRIICDGCDSEMEAFLNGLTFGTIILEQK